MNRFSPEKCHKVQQLSATDALYSLAVSGVLVMITIITKLKIQVTPSGTIAGQLIKLNAKNVEPIWLQENVIRKH